MSGTYFSLIYLQSKLKNLVSVPLETVTAADDPQLRNLLVNGKLRNECADKVFIAN